MSLRERIAAFLNPPSRVPAKPPPPENQLNDMQLALRSVIRGSYDSVQRTPENTRHWMWADHLAADASLNPAVRINLRSQSRYELNENNSYGRGMVKTVVTDTIGTGPRIQVTAFAQSVNQEIEKAWQQWACAAELTEKLTVLRTSKIVDGEVVAKFINNINLDDPVQLDLQLIEADQLRSPAFELQVSEFYVDGVHLDRFSLPYAYDLLQHHPGANYWTATDMLKYQTYPVSQIIHLFDRMRPGQHRGVPEFAPALPLFAFLRRFTLATVSAAETAASVSQVITTDAPIPEELETEYSSATFDKFLDTIPIDRNSATVLPNLWKLQQFAAEHPATTYAMFKRELISEIGRTLCVPTNIATGDSGESNYSSARFDWLGYERSVKKEQNYFNRHVLDRVFGEWLIEAALIGTIPRRAANQILAWENEFGRRGLVRQIPHAWYWDGMRDADQQDAAQAQRLRLQNGSTHRAAEYAEQGKDVEIEDQKAAESLGVDVATYRQWVTAAIFTNGNLLQMNVEDEQSSSETETGETNEQSSEASAPA